MCSVLPDLRVYPSMAGHGSWYCNWIFTDPPFHIAGFDHLFMVKAGAAAPGTGKMPERIEDTEPGRPGS